ncbi:unnamed protein product [Bursaphelenchus okinawaensis]|uniref:Transmembrane protein 218 N-terminal domain-containing protein n=1 Tax=Bursaphelenchus okinawaensis TaxID=465554 RepID=A0A811KMQ7_9BILA|nr:unnamed protein product [Bursaphelenchus okinawaensis]CAG9105400.1 unnamed protein product [Bursaphelenchus okinawaensis]
MSIRIGGLGPGVIILATLWGVCMTLYLAFSRSRGVQAGLKYIILAAVPTAILLLWPRESCDNVEELIADSERLPTDYIAIPRFVLAGTLVLLVFVFGIQYVQQQLFFVHRAIPIKSD